MGDPLVSVTWWKLLIVIVVFLVFVLLVLEESRFEENSNRRRKERTVKQRTINHCEEETEETSEVRLNFGKDGKKLIPVAVQDADTKTVLLLGSTNQEAFRQACDTRELWLYSKSRSTLWHKGATSGCRFRVEHIRINCDQNSLLYLVRPYGDSPGGVCHAKDPDGHFYETCFYREIDISTMRLSFILL